jgi:hypothetical protein
MTPSRLPRRRTSFLLPQQENTGYESQKEKEEEKTS